MLLGAYPYDGADCSSAATNLHFDGEASLNSSESEAQTQLGNPPLLLSSYLCMAIGLKT